MELENLSIWAEMAEQRPTISLRRISRFLAGTLN